MHENQQPQTGAFEPGAAEREAIGHEMHHYEDPRAASIETLKIIQKQRGWMPDGAIHAITDVLGIPVSDAGGVATFYSQTFRQPVSHHVIHYCDSVVCHIDGCWGTQMTLEKKLDIRPGQMTFDGRFVPLPIYYLGNCDKESNVVIGEDTHTHLIPEAIPELLERYR